MQTHQGVSAAQKLSAWAVGGKKRRRKLTILIFRFALSSQQPTHSHHQSPAHCKECLQLLLAQHHRKLKSTLSHSHPSSSPQNKTKQSKPQQPQRSKIRLQHREYPILLLQATPLPFSPFFFTYPFNFLPLLRGFWPRHHQVKKLPKWEFFKVWGKLLS